MNVAFPAVFLFLFVLPGFIVRHFSQRTEVRTFDHAPFSAVALKALIWACVVNVVAVWVVGHLGYEVYIGDIVRLLVGGQSSINNLGERLDWLSSNPLAPVGYFALTNGSALILALLWREAVERFEFDRREAAGYEWVRGEAPWYYLFSGLEHPNGKSIDAVVISAVVEFKEGSFLYTGVLFDYEVNPQGELDRLLLEKAQRRGLPRDRTYDAGSYVDTGDRFYPIAGDVFVLRYAEIKTLNVSYLSLTSPNEVASDSYPPIESEAS